MKNSIHKLVILGGSFILTSLISLTSSAVVDLGTYKGCNLKDTDFVAVPLALVSTKVTDQPLKMAFDLRENNQVDVYFVERFGIVKKYDAIKKTVEVLGEIPVIHKNEEGLLGIAVDPHFKKNHFLYFMYSFQGLDTNFRISRIPLGNDGLLNLAAEKVLIKIPGKTILPHTGGAMLFDAYGDLWVAMGDNSSPEAGPANTADLRGGIMRIHPDELDPKGYTIPSGNFGETFAAYFQAQGKADLAKDYLNPVKVRPEIYVKGTRNAYSLSVEPVRRWVSWGDVGPDMGGISEEHNLVKSPQYTGWPYFAGQVDVTTVYGFNWTKKDRAAPMNTTKINGVSQLPPNHEPILPRDRACAMNGPVFRYDGSNPALNQIPPNLDHKWIIGDCNGSYGFRILSLNDKADTIVQNVRVFDRFSAAVLVDMQQGPDGALYYIGWQSGVYRVDYKGSCKDPSFIAEKTGCADSHDANYDPKINPAYHDPRLCASGTAIQHIHPAKEWLTLNDRSIAINANGWHEISIFDIRGLQIYKVSGYGAKSYALPKLPLGVYQLLANSSQGTYSAKLSRLH